MKIHDRLARRVIWWLWPGDHLQIIGTDNLNDYDTWEWLMAQVMLGTEDQITGLAVRAFRKGEPWVLPLDVSVTLSSEVGTPILTIFGWDANTGAITISRSGTNVGNANLVATGGGLFSEPVSITVQPGTADALVIDESGAVHA